MKKEELENWWMKEGVINLNRVLVNFAGQGIGYVPLTNMLSDFCALSSEEEEALVPFLVKDGAAIKKVKTKSERSGIYIWLK